MKGDLTQRDFPEPAYNGALRWLFEGFRTRMRDTAKAVRHDAAWYDFPTVHRLAKGLQERLTTDADHQHERQKEVHRLAKRCADVLPTETHIQKLLTRPREDSMRPHLSPMEELAKEMSLVDGEHLGISMDEVLELYRAEYQISEAQYQSENPNLAL